MICQSGPGDLPAAIARGNTAGADEPEDECPAGQAATSEGVLDGAARERDLVALAPLLQGPVGRVAGPEAHCAQVFGELGDGSRVERVYVICR